MREVQLYINDLRVDLFDDEQINVTSSTQNIQDIAKVFTDFSQTFTVPASPNNNAIFDHYYNNDVDGDFLAKDRQEARIEINYTPFRRGKVQLEGAELKEGEAYAYRVTFYGDVVTLKDLFGDDKLKDLDYTGLNFQRSGANVQAKVEATSLSDIMFPLISSERVWSYGDAASTDISDISNPIDYTELFPALKVSKIFDLIESKYGVTFNGNFLTNKRFTNLYTWWKNREDADFSSEPLDLTFDFTGTANVLMPTYQILDTPNQIDITYLDMFTYPQPANFQQWYGVEKHAISLYVYNTSTSSTFYVDVYKNGVLSHTVEGTGDTLFTQNDIVYIDNVFGLNDTYTFKLRSTGAFTFDFVIKYGFHPWYINSVSGLQTPAFENYQVTTTGNSISDYIDFSSSSPDMLISDYFSGVLRMFNLTCYPLTDELNFQIEPLEDWYSSGATIDITQYVDVDQIKVDRPRLYKEINFEWSESKSFMNEAYLEANGRQYGGLREYFGYDGGEFNVSLPFETLNFNKFTGENLQVAYSLTKEPDYKPYIPAPVMLYAYENQTTDVDFYLHDGTSANQITNYIPFGQEVDYNNELWSINFNEEISSLTLQGVENSLYMGYYYAYLKNLFSDKTRVVTVKTALPVRLLDYIELNDALVIRDKKYRINTQTSNLTTGEVELVLISDWKNVTFRLPWTGGFVWSDAGDIKVPVKPVKPNKGGYVTVTAGTSAFTTPSETLPYNFTEEGVITFTYPANSTGVDRQDKYTFEWFEPDGTRIASETLVINQKGTSGYLLTGTGSYLITETLDRIEI